ncbi:MAG: AzlC family ABC transporter permease [Eubacteriales bacterium]|nr:AzlC family ABC transporter permease [Eubacteriales bacterium]
MKKQAFKAAFPHTLPVMAGYVFLGLGFGILLESKGFSFIWSFIMSIFIYAGSMQYASIELLASGAGVLYTALMTLIIQIRHLFYGLSLIQKYRNTGKMKPLLIHELTDETYSLICSCEPPEDVDTNWFYFFISILDHSYWVTGCTLGALLGSIITVNTRGIDFVMTALFIVIFTDQWLNSKDHRPAVIGVACSGVCLILFGSGSFIIPSMFSIILLLTLMQKKGKTTDGYCDQDS